LFRTIAGGIAGTEMESYAETLSDDNIWRIVAYIRSVSRHDSVDVPGDRARGEQLFWAKGNCGQCHMVRTRGGRVGPDLSRIGRQRSLTHLRASVVSPNEDLTPGYNLVTVVKPDGSKIVGVEKGLDNFSVQLMDLNENFHSFDRSELKSVKREFRSVMPENYGSMFDKAELDDLLAYLSSLRGEKNAAREAKR
jgi:quinoprotein glucose dehydrogenase